MTEFLIAETWESGAGEDVIEDDIRCFKSRDARFCVSQGKNAFVASGVIVGYIAMGCL